MQRHRVARIRYLLLQLRVPVLAKIEICKVYDVRSAILRRLCGVVHAACLGKKELGVRPDRTRKILVRYEAVVKSVSISILMT